MAEDKKICPIMSTHRYVDCQKEQCQWWDEHKSACAIQALWSFVNSQYIKGVGY